MFERMSNREFSDWLADEAMRIEQDFLPYEEGTVAGLREASQRIKSSDEFQFDVRVIPKYEDQV